MLEIEVSNRSGVAVDDEGAIELARDVLAAEGMADGELGIAFVGAAATMGGAAGGRVAR